MILFASSTQAASFKISPSSGVTFKQNCQSSLDVILDTENGVSNAADIILNYDQSKIEVTEIRPGNVYPNYFGNVIDQNSGILRLTGANFTSTLNGHGVFATIIFKPKVNTGTSYLNIRFTGAYKYNSLDSNIADAVTSNDLLTSVQNGFFALSSGNCVTDSIPPTITFISPVNNQTGVPSTANILVDVADYGSGVDINSVVITINGVVYTSNSSRISYTGSPSLYHFTLRPLDPLYPDSVNTLQVSATDLTGNSVKKTINFNLPVVPTPTPFTCPVLPETTPIISAPTPTSVAVVPTQVTPTSTPAISDTSSPSLDFLDPRSKDTISLYPTIKFRVIDDTAINFDSLKITLNDQIFTFDNPLISKTGTSKEAIFTLKVNKTLVPNIPYLLTVFIADSAGNGVSQSISLTTTDTLANQFTRVISSINPLDRTTPKSPTLGYFIIIPLLLLLIYLLYKLLTSLTDDHQEPYGLVFDAITHEPIDKAKVLINGKAYYTNIFGIFAAKLKPGKYNVAVSAPNYTSTTTSFTTKTDFDTYLNISLKPIKTLPSPRYSLTPPHGYVVDKNGNPQTFLKLTLRETKFDAIVTTRITDKLGRYRFIVPHGRYEVEVEGHPHSGFVVDTRHKISGYLTINKDIMI